MTRRTLHPYTAVDYLLVLSGHQNKTLIKSSKNAHFIRVLLVREAGLEPARPYWTLEPESSESANSTTRANIKFTIC
jgi:hypothetical protein